MESATNSWDEANMMALSERTLDVTRRPAADRRVQKLRDQKLRDTTAEKGNQSLSSARGELADTIQSVKEELNAVRRDHAKLQQAVYEAAQVQRRLCAPRELVWGEFEIAGEIFPVRHLSGDFFKVMQLDSVLGLAVGDIAGKGLTAGIWQAHVMGLIQRGARGNSDAAAAVADVNRELCQDQDERPLTALFFARLDPHSNELVYCNAGLPAPLLLRQNKTLERLEAGGPMLGAMPTAVFQSGRVRFNPGDMLIAYSDGVTECRNSEDEEFEDARLSAAAGAVSGASANQALFSTLAAVLDFADACPPSDDLTLLVVRRRGVTMKEPPHPHSKCLSASRGRPTSLVRPRRADRKETIPYN
jgi:serine phosphatase RsbU (regulator of sigma subunit)